MTSSYVLVCGSASAALALYLYFFRRNTVFPPGPKPLPLLGNLFDVPVSHEYKRYTEWGKLYGDVVHVSALGKHIVVLNSFDAAHELLHVRSSIYSDRPFIPMAHEPSLMDMNWSFGIKPYSPEWRRHRRLFAQHLNPTASRAYFDIHTSSAHALLRLLLDAPEEFEVHLKSTIAKEILAITYGYQARPTNDPLIGLADSIVEIVGQGALPNRFFVNVFPWLKHVPEWAPGGGFKSFAAKCRELGQKLVEMPFEDAKRRVAAGTAPPSFVTTALTDTSGSILAKDIQEVAATIYGAVADTTFSTALSCILALVLHPEIQIRAQAELDAVLGPSTSSTSRLPTFSDRPRILYTGAIIKEALRWLPAAAIGIPHATTEPDVYRGWTIPKGAIVIANAWAMLHDEKTYPDSLEFRPEPFLGKDPAPDPSSRGCFGFGRRECPGYHLAEVWVWILISSLLATCTLSPAKDENGADIDVSYACEPLAGLVYLPQPFPFKITPRSKEAEIRIREITVCE